MSKLFILGAGFSKALNSAMPLLSGLSDNLDWDNLPGMRPQHHRLKHDVELLLSYLYQELPWKSPEEKHADRALFYNISGLIADYIADCEKRSFQQELPTWAMQFVRYLDRTCATVATLNYDTALERLMGQMPRDDLRERWPNVTPRVERDLVLNDLYRMPMLPLENRSENLLGHHTLKTFRMLKPHGSINWYHLGDDDPAGTQIFYDGIAGFYPDTSDEMETRYHQSTQELRARNRRDLVPLIVPPVAEKSVFYESHAIKMLWAEFADALREATEIYFVGYSLPKSDLSMRLFLAALAPENVTVYRVNRNDSDELKENYADALRHCQWRDDFLGGTDAIERMTNMLNTGNIEQRQG